MEAILWQAAIERAKARTGMTTVTRGRRPSVRRALRLAAVGAASLALSGTAVAAISGWNPLVGNTGRGGQPSFSEAPVPDSIKQDLEVLRRPTRPIDRSPVVQATLHGVGADRVRGVHLDSVRYLAPAPGNTASILFVADGSEDTDVFAKGETFPGVVCVYSPIEAGTAQGEAASTCVTPAQLSSGEAIAQIEQTPNTLAEAEQWISRYWIFGLVPDGVATVRLESSHGETNDLPVKNNFFELSSGYTNHEPGGVECTTWFDAKGNRISSQPTWRGGEGCQA
jgi:hypothetical protein